MSPLCQDDSCRTVSDAAVTGSTGYTLLWELGQPLREAAPHLASLRTIGSIGGGPGEYRALVAAGFSTSGEILALDPAQQRLLAYDSTGAPLRTTRMEVPAGFLDASFAGGHLIVAATLLDRVKNRSAPVAVFTSPPGSADIKRASTLPVREAAYAMGDLRPVPRLFQARSLWAIGPSGRIAYTAGDSLLVTVYDTSGSALLRFGFTVAPRKVTEAEIQRERERRVKGIGSAQMRAGLQGPSGHPAERHAAITDLRELENGETWVREAASETGDSARWIAFDSAGTARGTVTLPAEARVLSAWQGLVLVGYLDGAERAQWMRVE